MTPIPPLRPRSNAQWFAMIFGASLAAVGAFHFLRHAMRSAGTPLGVHDWAPVVIMIVGAGIAFNREVVSTIRAMRGGKGGDE